MIGKYSRIFFTVSVAILAIAVFLVSWGGKKIVDRKIKMSVQLDNSSVTYDKWLKMPMPMFFKVYVFNVTNPDEVNEGAKPKLNEIGPYIYREYRERTVLGYGPNDTIRYMLKKSFVFDQEMTGDLTEDDEVTVINFSYLSVQLDNSSVTYDKWLKMPMPMFFKVYVFNVTNPDEVNEGAKPKLNEIGPYIYREYRERTVLGYGPNDTIRYMLKKSFVFDQEMTGDLTEDDEVTVINFSYLGAILTVNDLMPSFVGMVNGALEQFFTDLQDPFLRVKVKDLFFDGIFLNCNGDNSALGLVCGKIKAETPPTMRIAEDGSGFYFSMFAHLNNTETGPFDMIRGRDNIQELGHIVAYKNKTMMTQWGDDYCGQLNGTDSSIFPPINENNVPKRLYIFEPDVCRSMYVELIGKEVLFDIPAYYYELTEAVLAAKSANPSNKCFCKKNWSANHDGCLLMGLLNLSPCQGAPAIASLPHFYLASEELLEYFDGGVQPNQTKHKTFVYIDPVTGVPIKGLQRLQFNIELRNMPEVPQLAKVPTGLFPLLWIEEGAEIPDAVKEELKSSIRLISNVRLFLWILLGVAILTTLISAITVVKSGVVPFWPRATNSVSFILRSNADTNKNI